MPCMPSAAIARNQPSMIGPKIPPMTEFTPSEVELGVWPGQEFVVQRLRVDWRTGAYAARVNEGRGEVVSKKSQIQRARIATAERIRRAIRRHHLGKTNRAVAVQVLLKTWLERFQVRAGARDCPDGVPQVIAVGVGIPHRVLVGRAVLPRQHVAARR